MIWLSTAIAFLISFASASFIIPFSIRKNLLDYPDERKIHRSPTPRLGGIPFFLGFFLASPPLFFSSENFPPFFLSLLPALFIFLIGLLDDIWSLTVTEKLLAQSLAVLLFAFLP
ncbi:MAG: undecaprenyl/decaprenyl-phosphate alpha-N-acetylglucosaminyl 1-phosphate transferase, partial [bacterium]